MNFIIIISGFSVSVVVCCDLFDIVGNFEQMRSKQPQLQSFKNLEVAAEIAVTGGFLKHDIIVYVEYFVFDLGFDGRKKTSKLPRFRLWTFPVLVKGPFGVVSATELIGIVLVLLYVIWALYAYTVRALDFVSEFDVPSFRDKRYNNPVSLIYFQHLNSADLVFFFFFNPKMLTFVNRGH